MFNHINNELSIALFQHQFNTSFLNKSIHTLKKMYMHYKHLSRFINHLDLCIYLFHLLQCILVLPFFFFSFFVKNICNSALRYVQNEASLMS